MYLNKLFLHILYILAAVCLCSCPGKPDKNNLSQVDTALAKQEKPEIHDFTKVEARVKQILSDCHATNALKLAKTTVKFEQDESICIDGREINFYTSEGQLVKISDKGYFADDSWDFELYYQNNEICLIIEELEGGPVNNPSKSQVTYYIDNNKIIRIVENNVILKTEDFHLSKPVFATKLFNSFTNKDYPPVLCDLRK